MPLMGGGRIGPSSGAKVLQLSDTDGVDTWEITDSDGFTLFKIDSTGQIYTRRGIQRI